MFGPIDVRAIRKPTVDNLPLQPLIVEFSLSRIIGGLARKFEEL